MVEIAYGIVPVFQGHGYATEAAQAAVAFAFGSGQVRHVRAHTFPTLNASTRVLAKCGFTRSGEVEGCCQLVQATRMISPAPSYHGYRFPPEIISTKYPPGCLTRQTSS